MNTFAEAHRAPLEQYALLSGRCGSRSDYVQGGGGNTSVKVDDHQMAIKASGYRLRDITPEGAYVVLDYQKIAQFYREPPAGTAEELEAAGAAVTREATVPVAGMPPLRPSVEAGFHSILRRFVVHTHSVYANLAACAWGTEEIAERAFAGADYTWGVVGYAHPGAGLTVAIGEELRRVRERTGSEPSVILMENHGIICHDDDPERCFQLHADANRRLASQFGLQGDEFPEICLQEIVPGLFEAGTPQMAQALQSGRYTAEQLVRQPLYPDQLVFLDGTLAAGCDAMGPEQCALDLSAGHLLMRMSREKAQVTAETLAAVLFVQEQILAAGRRVRYLGEAAKTFLSNWESEKYRKSLSGRG